MSTPWPEDADAAAERRDWRWQELVDLARVVWRLLLDPAVPARLKLIPGLAVAYLVSPLDLLPDSVPLATQLDDVAVLLIAARLFIHLAPRDRLARARGEAAPPAETLSTTYRLRED